MMCWSENKAGGKLFSRPIPQTRHAVFFTMSCLGGMKTGKFRGLNFFFIPPRPVHLTARPNAQQHPVFQTC